MSVTTVDIGGGKMRKISDIIEQYLKQRLKRKGKNVLEIKRSEVADQFQCVPSQINYDINTRFTVERGYLIESKRGGGGYIRITRVEHQDEFELLDAIIKMINTKVSKQADMDVLVQLQEKKVITTREMKLMAATLDREVLAVMLPARDQLRARILSAMLTTLKYNKE